MQVADVPLLLHPGAIQDGPGQNKQIKMIEFIQEENSMVLCPS